MQVTSLLLLALSAAAIASPIDIDAAFNADIDDIETRFNGTISESSLEKRATFGWAATFADGDNACKGGYADPRPKIKTGCAPVNEAGRNLGVCLCSSSF